MPSINKTSLREQIEKFKAEFIKQSSEGVLPKESLLLIKNLLAFIELIAAIFLEKQTTKNNKNSSKPSSQVEKDESALPDKGSKGKGKSELNETAFNSRTKETVTVSEVSFCDLW